MAVDEAVLRAVEAGRQPPTLRLYGWWPPAVSLGCLQSLDGAVDREACRQLGVEVVRRPTGGRAVFHHRELTYSVALPPGHPLARGGVLATYRRLSEALQAGLEGLGLQTTLACSPPAEGRPASAACFDAPSRHELRWRGRKLAGSAQMRRASGAVLQHGSLPLRLDAGLTARLLSPPGSDPAPLAALLEQRAASLEEALGRPVGWEEAARAVARGFERALGVWWAERGLSAEERALAASLEVGRYASPEWTERRAAARAAPGAVPAGTGG